MQINLLFVLGVICLLYCTSTITAQKNMKPNIIIIQVDDMGYDDLSINGNSFSRTPNIDSFSKEAVRFSNFFVKYL